jgi:hypothetical protein
MKSTSTLPEIFIPLLWSFDFSRIDSEKDKKIIILNAINYGSLNHWRWIVNYYGKDEVRHILSTVLASEIKPRTRKLVSLLFFIPSFNYASRSTH